MNERIRELAIESQLVYEDSGRLLTAWLEHVDLSDEVKKFAELIVKECAGIYSKIDNGNAHLGTEDYLEALQKHFGVE
jgi:hypothetical protein